MGFIPPPPPPRTEAEARAQIRQLLADIRNRERMTGAAVGAALVAVMVIALLRIIGG